MKKYFQLIKLSIQEYFVYRLNFILWRFRSFVFFLSLIFFWLAVYGSKDELLGYQKAQMLTYTVGAALLRGLVLSTRTADLAGQIRSGELSRVVLWPVRMIGFWFCRDLADKMINLFFVFFEIGLVLWLFNFPFYFPHHITSLVLFFSLTVMAMFLFFFISFFLSVTAFWTQDIWATRWLFGVILLNFFAGAIFPVDLWPLRIRQLVNLTPFPYLLYWPLQVWLEQVSTVEVVKALLIGSFWLIFFTWSAVVVWKKGVRNYGAYGG